MVKQLRVTQDLEFDFQRKRRFFPDKSAHPSLLTRSRLFGSSTTAWDAIRTTRSLFFSYLLRRNPIAPDERSRLCAQCVQSPQVTEELSSAVHHRGLRLLLVVLIRQQLQKKNNTVFNFRLPLTYTQRRNEHFVTCTATSTKTLVVRQPFGWGQRCSARYILIYCFLNIENEGKLRRVFGSPFRVMFNPRVARHFRNSARFQSVHRWRDLQPARPGKGAVLVDFQAE